MKSRRRAIATQLLLLVLVTAGTACEVVSPDDPDLDVLAAQTSTFAAAADATVAQGSPGTNYGTKPDIVSDGSPLKWAYVKFDVSGLSGTVTSARLRLYVSNGTPDGPRVQRSGDGWSETTITWNNKPAATGAILEDKGRVNSGAYMEVDVTAAVAGNGTFSFVLIPTSNDGLYASSRQATSNRPQLVVVTSTSDVDAGVGPDAGVVAQPSFPIRAAFYYPWFPETWGNLSSPFTMYHPSLGTYDSSDASTIIEHIDAMEYGGIQAGIASWWGQGTKTDGRVPLLLDGAAGRPFFWTLYHEMEGSSDPSVAQIQSDLVYIRDHYAGDPNFLRVNGKFVVFVYAQGTDGCGMADRWKQANTVGAYVVLKVFAGYKTCASQPDGWHQYAPAVAEDNQPGYSYSISPGFWLKGEASARLARDPARWQQSIQRMIASNAPFQLVTTFDEWGEGTAVESAQEWASASGFGSYLDALHASGGGGGGGGCTPTTCAAHGWNCGPASDGCGGTLQCGTCSTGTCGGGGTPNVCGSSSGNPVLAIAGDIAGSWAQDQSTADAIAAINPTALLTLGDNVYSNGSASEFTTYYAPTWGDFLARTHPIAGNHDHVTANLGGYCGYFGGAAQCTGGYSYYSYDVGAWHVIALDSGCSSPSSCTDPMTAGSAMRTWLSQDLAAHPTACTLVYWHHPRFSSGEHGNDTRSGGVWTDLYNANVDVVLNGHDHDYERFAPQTPGGVLDNPRGIVEFVVGTGGTGLRAMGATKTNSLMRQNTAHGVLKLTLKANGYDFQFVPIAGQAFADQGSATCH